MNHKALGVFFKTLRKNARLNRAKLSEKSGIAPMTIRGLEEGRLDCKWSTLVLYAEVCGRDLILVAPFKGSARPRPRA